MQKDGKLNIAGIRKLAEQQSAGQLEACLFKTLKDGSSPCVHGAASGEAVDMLAKAAYIRKRMEREGIGVREAIRALGAQIRQFMR
jgi:hypothetical protein